MPQRGPARTIPFREVQRPGYIVERLLIETLPGFFVGANVYRPTANPATRKPAVLVAHGHWKHGRVEHTDAYSVPALCALLAANGYVALAYDMVGYNDTRQVPHKFGDTAEERLWSFGPLSLQLWNSLRMADYLSARPDVDPQRLAITGASGGGTQTYLLAAVDDRIQISIPAVMVSAHFQGDDPCEMAPGLRVGTNNVELAAAFAPRPMLLLSSTRDWTSQAPSVEFPAIHEIYLLLGAPTHVESLHVDAEHGYNADQRQAALRFLGKHFHMPSNVPEPAGITTPQLDLLIGPDAAASIPGAVNRHGVFRAWQRLLTARNEATPPAEKAILLRALTGGQWPAKVLFVATRGTGFVHRDGADDIVPARLLPGSPATPVLAVHSAGMAAAEKLPDALAARRRGSQLLVLDLFGTASAIPPPKGRHGDHLVFHYADDANRVQDILTGLAWLARGGAKPRLVCGQSAAAWCRLAVALAPIELGVDYDEPRHRQLLIPGLAAAGYPQPRD
jgi:dienelactone hydrolase